MQLAKRTSRIALAALITPMAALSLGGTATAAGGSCTGAPGASAIQQYCEAVPEAGGGSQHAGSSGSGSSGSGSSGSNSGVSSNTAATLSRSGTDGAAVARLAGGTKSSSSSGSKSKKKKSGVAGGTSGSSGSGGSGSGSSSAGAVKGIKINGPSDPSASPLKAATHAVASGPTVGTGVVWGLLGLSAFGAAGAVFIRRRHNGFEPPADGS